MSSQHTLGVYFICHFKFVSEFLPVTLNNTPQGRFIPWCDFTRNFCVHSPQAKGKGGRALLVSAGVVFPKTDDAKPSATGEGGRMGSVV